MFEVLNTCRAPQKTLEEVRRRNRKARIQSFGGERAHFEFNCREWVEMAKCMHVTSRVCRIEWKRISRERTISCWYVEYLERFEEMPFGTRPLLNELDVFCETILFDLSTCPKLPQSYTRSTPRLACRVRCYSRSSTLPCSQVSETISSFEATILMTGKKVSSVFRFFARSSLLVASCLYC